jgi:predicted CoA-binding protein
MGATIAVLGASSDRQKFGNKAVRALRDRGYVVIPVNPKEPVVEGEKSYGSLLDVPVAVDIATFYVAPAVGVRLLDDVVKKGIPEVWLNPGADGPQVVERAKALGLNAVVACTIRRVGADPEAY